MQGIPGVMVHQDDILITGPTVSEHLQSLETVLNRLAKGGLHIKKNKCTFMSSSVIYLEHKVDSEGLHPYQTKYMLLWKHPANPIPNS